MPRQLVDLGLLTRYDGKIKTWVEGSYKIVEQATAETGYLKTYKLQVNGEDAADSVKINIPKDYLVKSAEIKTCATADTPLSGLAVGDKYFDFTINTVGNDGTASHIYLAVEDAFAAYVAGDGITITGQTIAASIGDGLEINSTSKKIEASVGDGLEINGTSKKIEAAIGAGLEINSSTKVIDLSTQNATTASDANAPTVGGITKADYVGFKGAANTFSATAGTATTATSGNATVTTTPITVSSTSVGGTATADAFHFNVTDTTYGNATATTGEGANTVAAAAGLMSGTDKDNLDALIAALGNDVEMATNDDIDALFE